MSIDHRLLAKAARRAAIGVGVLLFAAWLLVLRPQALGGPAAYITVAGVSMEPTLHAGDLVVMTRADAYEPGDVVAYRVPDGDPAAGRHVIHRVIGGGAEEGYLLQGDNSAAPDRWRPTDRDIVGRQLVVVPGFGSVLMLLKTPAAMAGLAAALVVFALPQWSTPVGGAVPTQRRDSSAPEHPARAHAARIKVTALNQAILVNEHFTAGACSAQILIEFRNVGTEWAEVSATMSTYSTIGRDGSTTAHGSFTSVRPRRLAPGETGYMLADISDPGVSADQLVGVSTVFACREARAWVAGADHRSPWRLVPA